MRFLQRISLKVSFTHQRSRLCQIPIELLSSAEPARIHFYTSSSDEIPTKNQLEGQFHTPAVSLVSNSNRVVKFCGTNSYLFFTPHRVMRFLQRISLKVSLTPAVSIKLLSSEEPTSYPIFHTLPSGEILTKSQLEGHSFYTLPSGEIPTKS